jgi:hypothetical protein
MGLLPHQFFFLLLLLLLLLLKSNKIATLVTKETAEDTPWLRNHQHVLAGVQRVSAILTDVVQSRNSLLNE